MSTMKEETRRDEQPGNRTRVLCSPTHQALCPAFMRATTMGGLVRALLAYVRNGHCLCSSVLDPCIVPYVLVFVCRYGSRFLK